MRSALHHELSLRIRGVLARGRDALKRQHSADGARAVQCRTRTAQQFGAREVERRIQRPVDLAAEAVLGRNAVDQDESAIGARTGERDAHLTVVGKEAVAAVAIHAGHDAQ